MSQGKINYNLNKGQFMELLEEKEYSIKALREDNTKKEMVLDWFNHFVDYVADHNKNLYNEACEYADKIEQL